MIIRSSRPSQVSPGELLVVITGASLEEVQGEIFNMEMEEGYSQINFTLPVRASDQQWVAQGRVRK